MPEPSACCAAPACQANTSESIPQEEDDKLFAELEKDDLMNDPDLSHIRERRMEQLKREMTQMQEMKMREHGTYTEVLTEKEIMKITTSSQRCVVHFYHKEFRRCMIMDKHLSTIARKYFKTKFVKIEVENAPFLVEKLLIQILPCVIAFVDGIAVDRVVGFEELGNTDGFDTKFLEKRLGRCGVIDMVDTAKTAIKRKTIFGKTEEDSDESD